MGLKGNIVLLVVFLLVMAGAFAGLSPYFLSVQNFLNIVVATATIGTLAVGAAFVIGAAGLDLSVGAVMALSAVAAAVFTSAVSAPWPVMILVCLASGTAAGAVNGILIGYRAIPAFIVTLGMLSIARGLALIVTDARPVYGLPEEIVFIGQGTIAGIPVPALIFVTVCAAGHVLLRHTAFGRHSLAIGDNEEASRNAGVSTKRHKVVLYAFSGFLAALAGLVFMGRVNAADPASGVMYELTAITAAIIGGTSLFGGKTTVMGAMLGALIMGTLQNGLNLLAVPAYYQQLAIGVVLILAVGAGSFSPRLRRRKA